MVQCLVMKFLVTWLMTVYQLTESTNRCRTKIYRHKLLMPTITHLGSQPCQQSVFGKQCHNRKEKAETFFFPFSNSMCPATDIFSQMKSCGVESRKRVVNHNTAGCIAQGPRYLSWQCVCDCFWRKTFPHTDGSHCSSHQPQADSCSRGAPPSFCSHVFNNFFYPS